MRLIKFYYHNSPAFINPAWLSTISRQYMINYSPVFNDPAWLLTISRQYEGKDKPVFINPAWFFDYTSTVRDTLISGVY